jgi:hypothetical protein
MKINAFLECYITYLTQQVRKCMHSITILTSSSEIDFCECHGQGDWRLSGWAMTSSQRIPLGIPPHSCAAVWGSPTQSLLHTQTHASLHVSACYCCPIFPKI